MVDCEGIHDCVDGDFSAMKTLHFAKKIGFVFGLISLMCNPGKSQCLISKSSARGYQVDISLEPDSLIKPSTCTWGYNYNVAIKYQVSFSGSNIPSGLNTLNAYLYCGSNSLYYGVPKTAGAGSMSSGGNIWRGVSDCNTATLKSLGCDSFRVHIQGPGIPNQYVNCAFVLPVVFGGIETTTHKDGIKINWTTYSERNNSHFILEVFGENDRDWLAIDTIQAAGNSMVMKEYHSLYKPPFNNGLYRFRVKQVDMDSNYTYSEVKRHYYKVVNEGAIQVFPNPSTSSIAIYGFEADAEIEVRDELGRRLEIKLMPSLDPNVIIYQLKNVRTKKVYVCTRSGNCIPILIGEK